MNNEGDDGASAAESGQSAKAYEEISTALRRRIAQGRVGRGERLPTESELATEFGVSRATTREALRILTAQDLITTKKGSRGGSFVTVPRFERITDYLEATINVLSIADRITLDELLEARCALEVPAARYAAERRRVQDIERMQALSSPKPYDNLAKIDNAEFHSIVVQSSGNALLALAAQPIFAVLMTNARGQFTARFDQAVKAHHHDITRAIEAADAESAGALMEEHLAFLRPHYERAWMSTKRSVR